MKKKKRRRWRPWHAHGPGDHHPHGDNLAERLTPLEETEAFRESEQSDASRTAVKDTIRVDSTSVKLPEKFLEEERGAADTFRLHPVVIAIVGLMLAFIAFIAWQITLMPPPAK